MTAIIRNVRADDAADPRDLFPIVGKGALVVSPSGTLRWKILLENGGDRATAFLFVVPSTGQVIVSGVSNNLKGRLKTFQVLPSQKNLYAAMRQHVGPVHVLAAEFGGTGSDDELRRSLVATYGSAANVAASGGAKRHDAAAPATAPVLDTEAYGEAYADATDAGDIPDAALTAAGVLADLGAIAITAEDNALAALASEPVITAEMVENAIASVAEPVAVVVAKRQRKGRKSA